MSSFSDKAKQIIGAIAPTVGTALGGPFGTMAGVIVAKALGVDPAAPKADQAVNEALATGSPEIYAKLRQAEEDFQLKMTELNLRPEQLANEDRASARQRETVVKDRTPAFLAYAITVGFFGTLAFLLIHGVPQTGGEALLVLLGSLATAWAGVVAYYFGSTKGSADKTKALSDIAKMP